tara:strand:- start:355 stop:495 length:141 start_codon:yes stop_codon:yes gene_type:complete
VVGLVFNVVLVLLGMPKANTEIRKAVTLSLDVIFNLKVIINSSSAA